MSCCFTFNYEHVCFAENEVRFSNSLSNQFTVGNGVKQGGVLSPILLTVYIDNLIKILKQ